MKSKMQVGAAHPKATGTLVCPTDRHTREKAEELGLSQAHPSGLQRPQEAAGTCPVGKGVHGWL